MQTRASSLHAAALAGLERAINAALALDPAACQRLAELAGTVIAIHCSVPAASVFVLPGRAALQLRSVYEQKPDCTVSGKASDFIAVLGATDKATALVNGGLHISGDSAPLLALEKALAGLDLDWEQRLAVVIGDIPAHQLGRGVRGTLRWGARTHEALLRHVEEFVHEEARLAPPRLEVEDFFTDLQALAQRTERAEAGSRRLARKLAALAGRLAARKPGTT